MPDILNALNLTNEIFVKISGLGKFVDLIICFFVKFIILVAIIGSLYQDFVGKMTLFGSTEVNEVKLM